MFRMKTNEVCVYSSEQLQYIYTARTLIVAADGLNSLHRISGKSEGHSPLASRSAT